jgi:hypothetical protein
LRFADGLNMSAYVRNDPVKYIDQNGLSCACGEALTQAARVGLGNAIIARALAQDALAAANASGLSGITDGQADAFRHCFWSCEMAKSIGGDNAISVGQTHEECGTGTQASKNMDIFNNGWGVGFGVNGSNCNDACYAAATDGRLQTSL